MHNFRTARRAARRTALTLAMTLPLLGLAPGAAYADYCQETFETKPPTTIYYPCPGPQDQPVPAPVWVSTEYGPGYNMAEWSFIKVYEGSRVFLTNATVAAPGARMYGTGFDSGYIPQGGFGEVLGVPDLKPGGYRIYDDRNMHVGALYIERFPVET